MRRSGAAGRRQRRVLAMLLALALCGGMATLAHGERSQEGNLISSLDGGLSPLRLPRDRPAPVTVHLEGGLQTSDGSLLPRVTRLELGLPGKGVISSRGLPACPPRKLRNTTPEGAMAACARALVGTGRLRAQVLVPHQPPFTIHASLLAFNGRIDGRRAVILHAFSAHPPTVVVLPFLLLRPRTGRFRMALAADLPPSLGPWPHLAHFDMSLSRRYFYRGRERSYISASCPIPRINTAALFSFARATYTLAGGRRLSTTITRGCRAR
jgi:hypothetical protein